MSPTSAAFAGWPRDCTCDDSNTSSHRRMTAPIRFSPPPVPAVPRLQRARGRSRVSFRLSDGVTRLGELWQEGCAKVRMPRVHDDRGPVAVLINTSGGITGGDEIVVEARWEPGARATVTAQAAERIYRRSAGVGRVRTRLSAGSGAHAAWLPQETIVFDGAGLDRALDIDLSPDASLVAVESLVLGRTAMGERVRRLDLVDRWRLAIGGRLVFADALRLKGDAEAILSGPATGGGAAAFATLVAVGSDPDGRLAAVRATLDPLVGPGLEAGASVIGPVLAVRLLAVDGRALRRALVPVAETLTGGPLPRVWSL
jgi:urease accessory protein